MKKITIALALFLAFGAAEKAIAQEDEQQSSKETEEIIIRKKGSKDATMNIQISGDKITVNGKPLIEFKDDEITINKRKVFVRDGNNFMFGDLGTDEGIKGFGYMNSSSKKTAFLGVNTEEDEAGAKITEEVAKESAAGKAGLQKGDIILKLNDTKIDGPGSLYEAVTAKKPGDAVKISYRRNGKSKTTTATLQETKGQNTRGTFSFTGPDGTYKTFAMPKLPKAPPAPPAPPSLDGNDFGNYLDQDTQDELSNLQMDLPGFSHRPKLGLKIQDTEDGSGVILLDVEDSSAAAMAGLKKDDIITSIAGEKVNNTDEARERLKDNREKSTYQVTARRSGKEMNFTIKIPKKLKTANL